jgi:amino acid permease
MTPPGHPSGAARPMSALLAVGTFLGTVIGVGIFGLPFLASQMGFVPFVLLFVCISPLVIVIHLQFIDVVIGTKGLHRIPGYIHAYLGTRWRTVALIISALGIIGSLLAYLVVGGTFTKLVLQPFIDIPDVAAVFLFFLLGSVLIATGTKSVAWVDLVLTGVFFCIVAFFFFFSIPKIETASFTHLSWSQLPLGYGVILFALWGLTLVPETVELAGRDRHASRRVILYGLLATAAVYLLFTVMVLGVTGSATTPEALTGFLARFPSWAVVVGGLLGVITTFTSYIALGLTLRKTLVYDLRLGVLPSLCLTFFLPLLLFAIGLKSFIDILGLTGAVLLGLEGALAMAVAARYRALREKQNAAVIPLLIVLLCLGVCVELWLFLR